jgi:hypothetical protein
MNTRQFNTKRISYATSFIRYFKYEFNEMDELNQIFKIDRDQYIKYMFVNGLLPSGWDQPPTSNDREKWAYVRNEMNKVRSEMNKVSRLGMHGEPPFEAKVLPEDRTMGRITVRNLQRMAMVTYSEVGNAIETYLNNKFQDHVIRHNYFVENAEKLPTMLQGRIGSANDLLNQAIATATYGLEMYLEKANLLMEEAEQHLKLEHLSSE